MRILSDNLIRKDGKWKHMKIRLSEVIWALEGANDEAMYLYSIKEERIILLMHGMVDGEYDDELYEEIVDGCSEDYIALPDQFDIHEYRMMEDFIGTISLESVQKELYRAIRGRGAFRRFKGIVYELDLEKQWYSYRDQQYKNVAIEWCDRFNIEIIED